MNKLKKAIYREINYYFKRPVFAHLEVTYKCNLSCEFCNFRKNLEKEKANELSTDEWTRIIDELKEMGVLYITLVGAEPLIRKDILKIISHIKKRRIKCLLLTNGVLIGPETAKHLVETGLDKVTISVDGPRDIHDRIRGAAGVYDKATDGIKNIIAARNAEKSSLPKIGIHATVCSSNVEYLDGIADVYNKLAIDSIDFHYITETKEDRANQEILNNIGIVSRRNISQSGSLLLDEEGVRIMRNKINLIAKRKIHNFSINTLLCLPVAPLTRGHFPIKRCYVPMTDIHIDPFGNLHPCALLSNYTLGNALQEGVGQIWKSKKMGDLRVAVRKKLFNICKYCRHFNSNLTFAQAAKICLNLELK